MVQFTALSFQDFLNEYWQKKPLVIRKALPGFVNPLSADELAGLSMEEDIESRIVCETPGIAPYWHLKRGPFIEKDFSNLPPSHWTLLVQGVDRFIPEVFSLLQRFNFIPQWRIDDVMISYAADQGSVGPHYDNYDVFLYQAQGRRKWSLTTKDCNEANYMTDVDLRIMQKFEVEEEYILEEGDMLYLPPHVGHYGIAQSSDCMTYSFGYRSYQGQEICDSFVEYLSEHQQSARLYKDPNWVATHGSSEIPQQAWLNAKNLIQEILDDERLLQTWFGCFATQLDRQAENYLPEPLDEEETDFQAFNEELIQGSELIRNPVCRFAYLRQNDDSLLLFVNGCQWVLDNVSTELVKLVANSCVLKSDALSPFINNKEDQRFLFELWCLHWLEFAES